VRANYEQLPMGSREIIPARHFCHRFCDAGHSVCADPLIGSAADAKKQQIAVAMIVLKLR
jgi:hypothetical protein